MFAYRPVLTVGTEAVPDVVAWPAVCPPALAPVDETPPGPSSAVVEAVGDGSEGELHPMVTPIATVAKHTRKIEVGDRGRFITGKRVGDLSSCGRVSQAGQISRTAATILSALGRTAASSVSL